MATSIQNRELGRELLTALAGWGGVSAPSLFRPTLAEWVGRVPRPKDADAARALEESEYVRRSTDGRYSLAPAGRAEVRSWKRKAKGNRNTSAGSASCRTR